MLGSLPDEFVPSQLEEVIAGTAASLLVRPGPRPRSIRWLMFGSYQARFAEDLALSQQVLMSATSQESHGVEDARFVQFTADDGTVDYRGTYTAYDGQRIEPRLMIISDLRTFSREGLASPAAHNKGMAIFPRKPDQRRVAAVRRSGPDARQCGAD